MREARLRAGTAHGWEENMNRLYMLVTAAMMVAIAPAAQAQTFTMKLSSPTINDVTRN